MTYNLTHLGGLHTVTGSCHLLQTKDLYILIDCGTAQGEDHVIPITEWSIPPSQVDYLFLTHAHIDHIGRVPELVHHGFQGDIITTHATKALLQIMLEDAARFSDFTEHQTAAILNTIDTRTRGVDYDQLYELTSGIRFKFYHAGHILGSSFIRFEIPTKSSSSQDSNFTIVFSGDLGSCDTPILPDPDISEPCDLLVMESTYGDRRHEDRSDRVHRLGEALTRALSDQGKVFIPAFTLGRTQEILYEIDRLFSDPEWQREFPKLNPANRIPVFIDSPLGLKVTEIYSRLSESWDTEAKASLQKGDHPFHFEHLYPVANYQEHLKILDMSGPAIIIAGSGMCTGGRIINHLKKGIRDPRNDLFFIGYQANGTPGRDIIHYSQKPGGYVKLDGEKFEINAKIHVLGGYSAHADQHDLLNWVQAIPEKPRTIKLIHGELNAQNTLRDKLVQLGYHVHPVSV